MTRYDKMVKRSKGQKVCLKTNKLSFKIKRYLALRGYTKLYGKLGLVQPSRA